MTDCSGEHTGAGARRGSWTPDQCRFCWAALNAPPPVGRMTPDAPLDAPRLPCRFLGAATGETGCGTCGQRNARVPLHACAVHGTCTPGNPTREAHHRCATCEQHEPPAFRRHLLYHLYPRRAPAWHRGPTWRWNLGQLLARIDLFDGRRIVAAAADRHTDPAGDVRDALAGHGFEVIEVANDPHLRETATHEALFSRLADLTGPGDVLLRAHAKGVSNFTWPDQGETIKLWTEVLYETHLDYWPVVADLLARYPIVGALWRRGRYFPGSASGWHYSGSWYWVRSRELFARAWRRIEPHAHGVETYPSIHFHPDEAGVIWGRFERPDETSWPYRPQMWAENLPQLREWRAANAGRRTVLPAAAVAPAPRPAPPRSGPRLSIIIPTIGRASLARTLAGLGPAGLAPTDEVILVADGPSPAARAMWDGAGLPGWYMELPERSNNWGHGPRNAAVRQARGEWLLFLDDDDAYRPGAVALIRAALATGPRRPHLFRVHFVTEGWVCWRDRELRQGNVTTVGIVVPNDPARLGAFGARYEGDFDFASSTCAFYPDGPVWREEVVCDAAPARLVGAPC